jgi:hypothetical protein
MLVKTRTLAVKTSTWEVFSAKQKNYFYGIYTKTG